MSKELYCKVTQRCGSFRNENASICGRGRFRVSWRHGVDTNTTSTIQLHRIQCNEFMEHDV